MVNTFIIWKASLSRLIAYYETHRGALGPFLVKLYCFFLFLNVFCYWWGLYTAYPFCTQGRYLQHYFWVQFPVGVLGALFDTASFFITLYIIRRALKTEKPVVYIAHLSLDLLIAVLATFWVVYVFSLSGWLIHRWQARYQNLAVRNDRYQQMLFNAVVRPGDNLRNIYFGLVMGVSAMLPTCLHFGMFLQAWYRSLWRNQ